MIKADKLRRRRCNFPKLGVTEKVSAEELAAHPGIESLKCSDRTISIAYDLNVMQLDEIFDMLGFDPNRLSLIQRVFWWLIRYRESVEIHDLNCFHDWDSIVQRIYVTSYLHRQQPETSNGIEEEGPGSAEDVYKGR